MTVVLKLTHSIYAVTEIMLGGSNALMNGSYRFFIPLINEGWRILHNDLSQVAENTAQDALSVNFNTQMEKLIDRQKAIFLRTEDRTMGFDNVFIKMRRINEWVKIGGKESRLLHEQQEAVRAKYLRSLQSQKNNEKLTEQIVITGLIANILLALFLYSHFHRNFMSRINALSSMAKKLSLSEPVDEIIAGSGELQDIGIELAKVSWQLRDVSDYRQSLMQMMAHDVRSPLMAADISIATLRKFLNDEFSEAGHESLTEAEDALTNCLNLVNDLLLLESLENGVEKLHLEDCHLQQIVHSVVDGAKFLENVKIVNHVQDLVVRADHVQTTTVVERLLLSAALRAPVGSTVSVDSRILKNFYRLEVSDEGAPLPQVESSKLFDKLHQAHVAGGGKTDSLGLAIAAQVMSLHGGSIQYESKVGGNTIFIELPAAQIIGDTDTEAEIA